MPSTTKTATYSKTNKAQRVRRVLPAEIRIDDLMSAAAALFIVQGIDATTIDEIAAKAGVGKGTFYHYFSTKADIVFALRARFTATFHSKVSRAVEQFAPEDHKARFFAWVDAAVTAYLDDYQLHDIVFHDFRHSRRVSQDKDAVIAQLTDILDKGSMAKIWSLPDSHACAVIMFDGMHGLVDEAIAAGNYAPEPLCLMLKQFYSRILGL